MMYLHDVWVNFVEGITKEHNIPEFHEWRKTDSIELLDQTPLLFVSDTVYDYLIDGANDVPEEMLKAIYNKSYFRKNSERKPISHAAVVTDGLRVMAFTTRNTTFPLRKSKLIPRQYHLVLEMIEGVRITEFDIPKVTEKTWNNIADLIIDTEDVHMVGLTRREREMKEILMHALASLSDSQDLNEVRYWYTELFPGSMIDITTENWSIEKMILDIHDHLSEGWDEQHVEFGHKLVRYEKIQEDKWKELHAARVTKVDRTSTR